MACNGKFEGRQQGGEGVVVVSRASNRGVLLYLRNLSLQSVDFFLFTKRKEKLWCSASVGVDSRVLCFHQMAKKNLDQRIIMMSLAQMFLTLIYDRWLAGSTRLLDLSICFRSINLLTLLTIISTKQPLNLRYHDVYSIQNLYFKVFLFKIIFF